MINLHNQNREALLQSLERSADFIASMQLDDGAIPWFRNGKLDPWDHCEAAMGLSVMGRWQAAEKAYHWLAEQQLADGSWQAEYFSSENPGLRETHFIAYIATGVWHHYRITQNTEFLRLLFPVVERAIHFVLARQSQHGEIAWAVDAQGRTQQDALLTANSSILRSLECACHCAAQLNIAKPQWREAGQRLAEAIRLKPYRFDRTWESKNRFAMDWYYPILAGLCEPNEARARIAERWQEFFVEGLGCKCVCDEPWVTIAETSELIMALCSAEEHAKALQLFQGLGQWQDECGGYWTGYVYRDQCLWPEEKTTWTAAAVILAADALFKLSSAHNLFAEISTFKNSKELV